MNKRQYKKYITKATNSFKEAVRDSYGGWFRKNNRSKRFTALPIDKDYTWNPDKHTLDVLADLYGISPLHDNESSVEFRERIRREVGIR